MTGFKQSTVIGLAGGLFLLLAMMIMSPGHLGTFINLPGLLVVVGGTLAATLVSRPFDDMRAVFREMPLLLRDEEPAGQGEVSQLLRFAEWFRMGNLRAAERELTAIDDAFLHAGLRMVIDGCQPQDLAKSLQWRMAGLRAHEQGQAHILRSMAAFAPAFGMLGTLFGLMHMLSGLGDSGLGEIGSSMAFAMITTLYGIVAANLFFKPLAIKMERRTHRRLLRMGMLMEGILLTYEKRHPTLIRETLEAFELHHDAAAGAPSPQYLSLVKA
jgi:chemotaxis protein MotA